MSTAKLKPQKPLLLRDNLSLLLQGAFNPSFFLVILVLAFTVLESAVIL